MSIAIDHNATIDALERQVQCYRRLVKLAEIQHEHVQTNHTDGLIDVLQSRKDLLDEITTIEREIAPVKRDWSGFVGEMSSEQRTRADSLLMETRALLEQINKSDCNDVLVLQQRKLNLGRQIQQAKAARNVNRNYGAAAYGNPSAVATPPRMDVQQ